MLLGANGVPLETVTTDETGAARFATTRGLEREKAPAAVVVTNEATGDLAWLSLSDASNVDHDHDFSTAGRLVSEDGLTGLVFSERGIYRPGETVHAGMIVKTADWHRLPAGMPVTLRITDATGRTMFETARGSSPRCSTARKKRSHAKNAKASCTISQRPSLKSERCRAPSQEKLPKSAYFP